MTTMRRWWSGKTLGQKIVSTMGILLSGAGVALYILIAVLLAQRVIAAVSGEQQTPEEVSALLIAFGATAGAPFFIWRTWLHDQQTRIDRKRLISERFVRGVTQLGADRTVCYWDERASDWEQRTEPNMEARLGAIFELEAVSRENSEFYWGVIKTLCAYVAKNGGDSRRLNVPDEIPTDEDEHRLQIARALGRYSVKFDDGDRADVAAIVNVLGGRTEAQIMRDVDAGRAPWLRGCNLQRMWLSGLDFRFFVMTHTHLEGAILQDANLSYAYLKRAHLAGAELRGANLTRANVCGAELVWSRSLTQEQLESCFGDTTTKLPPYLTMPEHWRTVGRDKSGSYAAWMDWLKDQGHSLNFPKPNSD